MGELHTTTQVVIPVDVDGEHHTLVYRAGELVEHHHGTPAGPWAVVVAGGGDPTAWCDPATVASLQLRTGDRLGRPAPFDAADPAVFAAMPRIRWATLEVHTVLTASPWGTLWLSTTFDDGHVTAGAAGTGAPPGDADITATMSWSAYVDWRAGADVLEQIATTGSVEGRWCELLCLHGLVQSPGWRDAVAALPTTPDALVAYAAQQAAR